MLDFHIDTIEIEADNFVDTSKIIIPEINGNKEITGISHVQNTGNKRNNRYKINFVKCCGIDTEKLFIIAKKILINPVIVRIDFAFDDYTRDYDENFKITQLLLSCVANYKGIKNNYKSLDFMDNNANLSLKSGFDKFKGDYAIEYYNKEKQMKRKNSTTKIKSRFEIRQRFLKIELNQIYNYNKLHSIIYKVILQDCIKIIHTAIDKNHYKETVLYLGNKLIKKYASQDKYSLEDFIIKYDDLIYVSQLVTQLFRQYKYLNKDTAKNKASEFRRNKKIKVFDRADLTAIFEEFKEAIEDFSNRYKASK